MGFGEAIASGFANYVNFNGRAYRAEYWLWVLFTIIGALATGIVDAAVFGYNPGGGVSPLNTIFDLVTILPSLAVGARRLHDLDRTGWWLLLLLTVIGTILLIVWFCLRGTSGPNRYGPDPLPAE
jgi:uncharacterized membrane protein YhaH (DUF805 family)